MVIPTQVTPVQIHGGEVKNDLKDKKDSKIKDRSGQEFRHGDNLDGGGDAP